MGLSPLLSIASSLNQRLDAYTPVMSRDVCVRPGDGWKALFGIHDTHTSKKTSRFGSNQGKQPDEVATVLSLCKDDIVALWEDSIVRDILVTYNVRLEESSGLWVSILIRFQDHVSLVSSFLDDTSRITAPDYEPTDSQCCSVFIPRFIKRVWNCTADIVRARLRTMGVDEHWFVIEEGSSAFSFHFYTLVWLIIHHSWETT